MISIIKHLSGFTKLISLVILSIFITHVDPAILSKILFLIVLVFVWNSKKDYFWFAFVMILLEQPGGFFSGGAINDPHRLPIYNIFSGVSFGFEELYILTILFKFIVKNKKRLYSRFIYKKHFELLGFLLIILLLISIIFGLSASSLRNTYKAFIRLSLFISTLMIFEKEDDIISFFKCIFPFVFVAMILQLYGITHHQQLISLVIHEKDVTQGVLQGKLLRPIELSVVLLFSSFGSFLFLGVKKIGFSKGYLLLINITALLSITMTATRSWFLGFTIMYIFYILLNPKGIGQSSKYYLLGITFSLILLLLIPALSNQIKTAWTRIETIEELATGDETAGGTLSRLNERGPRVIEGFMKSTIILGAGFSDLYYQYGDGHVGYHNILLNSGIIGLFIFLSFAFILFYKPYVLSFKTNNLDLKHTLKNIPLMMPSVLIINSATQFWGFSIAEIQRIMMLAAYITISSFYINKYYALKLNKPRRDNNNYLT